MSDNGKSKYMTPGAVAESFNVTTKTVTRWASEGKLSYIRLPSGHRRYVRKEVTGMLRESRDSVT